MYALNADKAVSTIRSGIKKSCLFMGSGLIEAINCIMVSLYRKRTVKYMMQSMSRVAHCIDNGLMEGFWGILKRERYYGKRFTSKQELVQMIRDYIYYYNTQRVQRNLGVVTPMEKYRMAFAA